MENAAERARAGNPLYLQTQRGRTSYPPTGCRSPTVLRGRKRAAVVAPTIGGKYPIGNILPRLPPEWPQPFPVQYRAQHPAARRPGRGCIRFSIEIKVARNQRPAGRRFRPKCPIHLLHRLPKWQFVRLRPLRQTPRGLESAKRRRRPAPAAAPPANRPQRLDLCTQ